MPYKENRHFKQPADESVKVWRYMDITKFISLLQTRKLFFARTDTFTDPFEGTFTKYNHQGRMNNYLSHHLKDLALSMVDEVEYNDKFDNWWKYVAVNCWHMNKFESAAMWSLYVSGNEGIAIQSTYLRLKESLIDTNDVHLGEVNYIDFDEDIIEEDPLNRFVHKLKSYTHEQEVRAVIKRLPPNASRNDVATKGLNAFEETIEHGLSIDVNLEKLIESVYINPSAQGWFKEVIKNLIKIYGFKFSVESSSLSKTPLV